MFRLWGVMPVLLLLFVFCVLVLVAVLFLLFLLFGHTVALHVFVLSMMSDTVKKLGLDGRYPPSLPPSGFREASCGG